MHQQKLNIAQLTLAKLVQSGRHESVTQEGSKVLVATAETTFNLNYIAGLVHNSFCPRVKTLVKLVHVWS